MRKFFWGCTALAVAGGLVWAGQRGVIKVELDLGRLVSGPCATTSCCHSVSVEDCVPDIPTDPTPVDPEPLAVASALDLPSAGPEPDPVVPEAEPTTAPADDAQPVEPAIYKGRPARADQTAATRKMPYCEEDPATPHMPYADSEESELAPAPTPDDVEGPKAKSVRQPAQPTTPAGELAPCEEDRHYHEHYSGCPYSGHCPYSGAHVPNVKPVTEPPAKPTRPKGEGDGEESSEEPPLLPDAPLPKPGPTQSMGPKAARSSIDTMEFRPSDRQFDEDGPGPF
jgi:hypothetical protein